MMIMDEITMMSKFPGKCSDCGYKFPEGTLIKFNTFKRTARHVKCPEPDYSGAEQKNIFDMWIERAQDTEREVKVRRDKRR